jgi:hypothetical protein
MTDPPAEGPDPRRAHSRLQVGIDASLETLDGRQTVRLVDLSQAGAHLQLTKPEAVREGVLRWLNYEIFGMAMWQEGEEVGLKFDVLLPSQVIEQTRERAPAIVLEMAQAWVSGDLPDY